MGKTRKSMQAGGALGLGLVLACTAATATPTYVASSFSTNSIYFLDEAMRPLSNFTVADPLPNAVTATHNLLYAGYFANSTVVAYGYDGQEHFRWSDPALDRLGGLAAVDRYMAVASDATVYLFDAKSGTYVAQLELSDSIEGLAYDGQYLWTLGSQLVARDFDTGVAVRSIPNAALACDFGGTGIAAPGGARLMLGCSDGRWFEVSSVDGSVVSQGNNGLDMFDLAALPMPEPSGAWLLVLGLAGLWGAGRLRRGRGAGAAIRLETAPAAA